MTSLTDLPILPWVEILKYCSLEDIQSLCSSSKELKTKLPQLIFSGTTKGTRQLDWLALHAKNIWRLNLSSFTSYKWGDNSYIKAIAKMSNLQMVKITDIATPTDKDIEELSTLTKMVKLEFNGNRITDSGIPFLAKFSSLQHLTIRHAGLKEGLDALAEALPQLHHLNLSSFNEHGKLTLTGFKNLESLILDDCFISDANLKSFEPILPQLKELSLGNRHYQNEYLSDDSISLLQQCTQLEKLDLAQAASVSKATINPLLPKLPLLTELTLSNLSIDDSTMQVIATSCKKLIKLDVSGTNITNSGIEVLVIGCNKIEWLSIAACEGVDDNGIATLRDNLKDLKYIDIGLIDYSIDLLKTLPLLSKLEEIHCYSFSRRNDLNIIKNSLKPIKLFY